ncbi:MAG: 2-amino-4-hydroxy-6-hydroxymethyldihydropteridine diphosphokinase [Alphaproteobacteria bacterium]
MPTIILGLGSNLGDRAANLSGAVRQLSQHVHGIHCSAVYESKAVLPEGAPLQWDIPYYNMALRGRVECSPKRLLSMVKEVEDALGRRQKERWAPREIDIDILAYEGEMAEDEGLIIPHPLLVERDFALVPLVELWPDWRHPVECKTATELCIQRGYKEHAGFRKIKDYLDAA